MTPTIKKFLMTIAITGSLMTISQDAATSEQTFSLAPDRAYILPVGVRTRIEFTLSSKEGWIPSEENIAALEKSLTDFLDARRKDGKTLPENAPYARQYIGVEYDGKPMIYGNFYPSYKAAENQDTEMVLTLDGGRHYWAILYDPQEDRIVDIAFHGEA